jgi:hypothetical protein
MAKARPINQYDLEGKFVRRFDSARKSELVKMGYDPKKTEREIIEELGVPKIYDCGNIRFVWERLSNEGHRS